MKNYLMVVIWILQAHILDVLALRDMHIRVPEAVRVGDSVTLACDYDLEQVALYTIKWYRNDVEFYRYVPKESPPSKEFIVEHLDVDLGSQIITKYMKLHEDFKQACLKETNLSEDAEIALESTGEVYNNKKLNCFVKCINFKAGIFNEALEISKDNIMRNLNIVDEPYVNKLVETCSNFTKSNQCLGAEQFTACALGYMQFTQPKLV